VHEFTRRGTRTRGVGLEHHDLLRENPFIAAE